MKPRYDMKWGEPVAVREALAMELPLGWQQPGVDLRYPLHEGEPRAVGAIRRIVSHTQARSYKHVLVTSGCTQALQAALYAAVPDPDERVATQVAIAQRSFSLYPQIVALQGFNLKTGFDGKGLAIIDSPSNPDGELRSNAGRRAANVIWDAAYHSETYGALPGDAKPDCFAMCGSAAKTLGLPGLRVGWLGTDSQQVYDLALEYVTASSLGAGLADQMAVASVVASVDFDSFQRRSRADIDRNREAMASLKHIFGLPPDRGMFTTCHTDDAARMLLKAAGAEGQSGPLWGGDADEIRFSLGQNVDLTEEFAKAILKLDSLK